MNNEIINLKYCNEVIDLKKSIESDFILLGEYLYKIKENQMYEPQWSSFEEFCMELRMSENMVRKLMQIYKVFILEYGFSRSEISTAGGFSLLQDILPLVKSKKEALVWLEKTRLLTRSDLRKEIKEEKTGISMVECKHLDTYTITICKDCGYKYEQSVPFEG